MEVAVLGIDLGKNVCSIVGLDGSGAVGLRRRIRRDKLVELAGKLPTCIVAMEACCGAHHIGRLFAKAGHDVRLMSPEYVRPYVKAQKNDDRDAEGIAEAATRPTMRFVELKIVTSGLGWVQVEGGPKEEVRAGDVIWFAPGEKHWHGASPATAMT